MGKEGEMHGGVGREEGGRGGREEGEEEEEEKENKSMIGLGELVVWEHMSTL